MPLGERLLVYLIADYTGRSDPAVVWAVREALRGGATALQYRDKTLSSTDFRRRRAEGLLALARQHDALLIINDDLSLALDVGADGVHLGPHDLDPARAREMVPEGFIIGGSAGTVERAKALEQAGVDYLGVGAIFEAHGTKPDASLPRGPEIIAEIRRKVGIPVVAIGGIGPDNAAQVFEAGAHGVAVVRSVLDAEDPARVVLKLLAAARDARPWGNGGDR